MIPDSPIHRVSLLCTETTGAAAVTPYLSLHRLTLQTTYADGRVSAPFPWDAVLRKWLDAVTVVLLADGPDEVRICLRTTLRPPLLLRAQATLPVPESERLPVLLELPAGLIEDDDTGPEGILRRAAMETLEETGYRLEPTAFSLMKNAPLVSPGVIPERLWYAVARVPDPTDRQPCTGDGSVAEQGAAIQWVPLSQALTMCEDGTIDDMKTELGIRRVIASLDSDAQGS